MSTTYPIRRDSAPAARTMAVTRSRSDSAKQPAGAQLTMGLGKYREIVIAVAFFLLFDLGVLVLNFYTSFKIDQDTVAINLAGRQRYVSQRIARTLLELDATLDEGKPFKPETLAELRAGATLWQNSHEAFKHGATIPGGDGKPVFLEAVTSDRGRQLEAALDRVWGPYYQVLQPLMKDGFTPEQLAQALAYSQANNSLLLNTANDFVTETQQIGASRASTLRMVQTGGIVLALLNFAFILFKFVRRLQGSDAAIEAANEENREILQAVREGLFLLTPGLQIGSQLSSSVHTLFGRKVHAGDSLLAVLQPMVSEKVLSDARDYIDLLFSPHVKEQLVQGINPLSEVEVQAANRLGSTTTRHLSFHFNRVMDHGEVRHLLVTVQDITQRIELQARLAGERSRAQKEFSMLVKAFEADPAMLRQFVERAEATLLEINDLLRSTSGASSEAQVLKAVDGAYRRIHAFKGDASSLGLEVLTGIAHQFEAELQKLKDSGASSGDALLALPLPLEELLTKIAAFKALTNARAAHGAGAGTGLPRILQDLAGKVAADLGKRVHAAVRADPDLALGDERRGLLNEIAVQLVRNAVAHGIEAPATRTASGKSADGHVDVSLARGEGGDCVLSVRDDGAGLSAERVRRRLQEIGWYSAQQLAELSDRQVLGHIFKPGFSTASAAGEHAGRGVGLDLVQANIARLGAQLTVSTGAGQFTEFRVRVPG